MVLRALAAPAMPCLHEAILSLLGHAPEHHLSMDAGLKGLLSFVKARGYTSPLLEGAREGEYEGESKSEGGGWGARMRLYRSRTAVGKIPPCGPPLGEAAVPGVDDVGVVDALAQGLQRAGARLDGLEQVDGLAHARGLQGVCVVAGQAAWRAPGGVHKPVPAACGAITPPRV